MGKKSGRGAAETMAGTTAVREMVRTTKRNPAGGMVGGEPVKTRGAPAEERKRDDLENPAERAVGERERGLGWETAVDVSWKPPVGEP